MCKVRFTADVANCSTFLFLLLVPTFLPLDRLSALVISLPLPLVCIPCHHFWGNPFLTTNRSWDENLANVSSLGPYKPTMQNVVWVKESEEEIVIVRLSKTMTQESTWSGDSAGESGGEASVREELRNVLGELSYPLAECSLCLCS